MELESLDPNGSGGDSQNQPCYRYDFNLFLNRTYDLVQDAALKYRADLRKATWWMDIFWVSANRPGFYFPVHAPKWNFKPSIVSWDIVLRWPMGHPSLPPYLERDQKKGKFCQSSTLSWYGLVFTEMSPKTLSIIVAGFANMNDFEAVDEFLTKILRPRQGKGAGNSPLKQYSR